VKKSHVQIQVSFNPEDHVITIGTYTRAERKQKIARFLEKRAKRLARLKKGGYECRSRFAVARPRIGGRFISLKGDAGKEALATWREMNAQEAAEADEAEADEDEDMSESSSSNNSHSNSPGLSATSFPADIEMMVEP